MDLNKYHFDVAAQTTGCIKWIREWMKNNGNPSTRVIIGISGGKDSTVTAALLTEALGKERVIGVMLPCGNQVDIEDSKKVIEHLGIKSLEVNIGEVYDALTKAIRPVAENGSVFPTDAYTTNTPARIRMTTLYGIGAILGNCRVVNTCNLSENINGYATLWGDSVGDFAPIDLFTTEEIMAIGDYLGLPHGLVHKKPTDGMSLNDDGSLKGDEEKLGYSYEECNKIIRLDERGEHFEHILKQYHSCRFKLELISIPHYDPELPVYYF